MEFSTLALFTQAALGGLALLSLVWKRSRESPQRPLRIWYVEPGIATPSPTTTTNIYPVVGGLMFRNKLWAPF